MQLWRFKRDGNDKETMTLENKFLEGLGKSWEYQNYKWKIPSDDGSGDLETFLKFDPNCKFTFIITAYPYLAFSLVLMVKVVM